MCFGPEFLILIQISLASRGFAGHPCISVFTGTADCFKPLIIDRRRLSGCHSGPSWYRWGRPETAVGLAQFTDFKVGWYFGGDL